MVTKAESDLELHANLADIEAVQEAYMLATGSYKRVLAVPNTNGISVTEYKGGGRGPGSGTRNPGYRIVQKAEEPDWRRFFFVDTTFYRVTDKGTSGRSKGWRRAS